MTPEEELIRRAQKGDGDAFGLLIAPHQARLYRMIYRFIGNGTEARDLLQEVFIAAYQGLPKYQGRSAIYTWLYRIAIRICYREVRKARQEVRGMTESIDARPEEALGDRARREFIARQKSAHTLLEEKELVERVHRALKKIPKDFFDVLVLYEIEGLSYEETAEALAIPKGTVMSRISRARKKLLRILKSDAAHKNRGNE